MCISLLLLSTLHVSIVTPLLMDVWVVPDKAVIALLNNLFVDLCFDFSLLDHRANIC
jgi:hypothetical protein